MGGCSVNIKRFSKKIRKKRHRKKSKTRNRCALEIYSEIAGTAKRRRDQKKTCGTRKVGIRESGKRSDQSIKKARISEETRNELKFANDEQSKNKTISNRNSHIKKDPSEYQQRNDRDFAARHSSKLLKMRNEGWHNLKGRRKK